MGELGRLGDRGQEIRLQGDRRFSTCTAHRPLLSTMPNKLTESALQGFCWKSKNALMLDRMGKAKITQQTLKGLRNEMRLL